MSTLADVGERTYRQLTDETPGLLDYFYAQRYGDVAMKQRGFTLIELSIVLVIIGLIVGGVLVGQDLIRAAKIRAT